MLAVTFNHNTCRYNVVDCRHNIMINLAHIWHDHIPVVWTFSAKIAGEYPQTVFVEVELEQNGGLEGPPCCDIAQNLTNSL